MAGGLITTRAASESHLGEEVAEQLLARPRPLAVAAMLLVGLSFIPGLPKLAFLIIAAVFGTAAYAVRSAAGRRRRPNRKRRRRPIRRSPPSGSIRSASRSATRSSRWSTRSRAARSSRVCAPFAVRLRPTRASRCRRCASPTTCSCRRGAIGFWSKASKQRPATSIPSACSRSIPARIERAGRRAHARTGLRSAGHVDRGRSARGRTAAGHTVVDPTTALSTHLSEIIRSYLPDLLNRQQVKEMVDIVGQSSPKLIEELVPKLVSIGDIQRVLRQLLRERVPVRDLASILEAVADAASATKDVEADDRSRPCGTRTGDLPPVSEREGRARRDQRVSRTRRASAVVGRPDGPGRRAGARPTAGTNIASRIAKALEQALAQPVLLCSPTLRPHLWRLFARVLPHLGVLSHNEVPPQTPVVAVTTLD